jgi:hypothetical protein
MHLFVIFICIGLWSAILVAVTIGIVFKILPADLPDERITTSNTAARRSVPLSCEDECKPASEIKIKYKIDTSTYKQQKCCEYHHDLKKMLFEMDEFLRMQSISYWMSSGTLLGSLRHGTIIPWDEDADLYLIVDAEMAMTSIHLSETYLKLLSWSDVMPQSEYVLRPGAIKRGSMITSFKLHKKSQTFTDRLSVNGAKVDLQFVHIDDQGKFFHISNFYWYNKFQFPRKMVFPLKRCPMYKGFLPCPYQSENYLRLLYGNDVLTKAESTKDFWGVNSGRDGPQRKSAQEMKTKLKLLAEKNNNNKKIK